MEHVNASYSIMNQPLPTTEPLAPPRRRSWLPFIIIGVLLSIFMCIGFVVLIGLGGFNMVQMIQRDQAATQLIIDQFVAAGAQNDPATGRALFAQQAQAGEISLERIATLFNDQREYFDGYQSGETTSINITNGTQGTIARTQGTLTYSARTPVSFQATLVKEADQWRLLSIFFFEEVGT
jgi:hypothetical protein